MSALLQALVPLYVALAAALALALLGARGTSWALARAGAPLSASQRLRVARGALALALAVPLGVAAGRELAPAGALFSFERSVVAATGRLPAAALPWAPPAAPVRPGQAPSQAAALPLLPLGAALLAAGAAGLWALRLRQQARLLARLRALPRLRSVGRVAVAVGAEDAPAYSVWFPPLLAGPRAWVVVPSRLLTRPEALRITVMHELQHHRQGDTVLAYARLGLLGLFPWHPAAHLFSRWLAACGELACDEALVRRGRVRPQAYAHVLLEASLHPAPLPAGVAGMSHPTTRRIEMLFQPHPTRRAPAAALLVLLGLALAPLAVWAQGAARPRTVSLEQAQALARTGVAEGDLPVVVDAQVVAQLNRLVGTPKGRSFMQRAFENLKVQREPLARTLREKGLPEGLLAVAVIESAVTNMPETDGRPSLAPGMRGAGVWMFIPETARRYGLKVEAGVDERLDVARETQAAAAMFTDLHARYGDWRLALAAYNQGERKVDAALAKGGSRDVTALAAAGLLNDYVATVQAGLLLLRHPQLLD